MTVLGCMRPSTPPEDATPSPKYDLHPDAAVRALHERVLSQFSREFLNAPPDNATVDERPRQSRA